MQSEDSDWGIGDTKKSRFRFDSVIRLCSSMYREAHNHSSVFIDKGNTSIAIDRHI